MKASDGHGSVHSSARVRYMKLYDAMSARFITMHGPSQLAQFPFVPADLHDFSEQITLIK